MKLQLEVKVLKLSGSLVALVTPFDEKGNVDYKRLKVLLEYQISHNTDGIVLCGTTGESCTLTTEEVIEITSFAVKEVAGRIGVYVGTGTSSTRESVYLSQKVANLGADGLLVVTPFYNKPTQEGIYQHFKAVSEVGAPVIIYHNPKRAAVSLTLDLIVRLSELPNMVAIKESTGDPQLLQGIISKTSLALLGGEDTAYFSFLAHKAQGSINVIGNLIPETWKQIHTMFQEGKIQDSFSLFIKQRTLLEAVFGEHNPQGIKYAMEIAGLCPYHVRLPLFSPSLENCKEIEGAFEGLEVSELDAFPLISV